jgi:hypothetical protein
VEWILSNLKCFQWKIECLSILWLHRTLIFPSTEHKYWKRQIWSLLFLWKSKIVVCWMRTWHSLGSEARNIIASKFSHQHTYHIEKQIAHETVNLSDWDSCITRKIGLQIHLSEFCIHKKTCFFIYFHKDITCLSVGLVTIIIKFFFFVSCNIVYRWVMTYCCFMNKILVCYSMP